MLSQPGGSSSSLTTLQYHFGATPAVIAACFKRLEAPHGQAVSNEASRTYVHQMRAIAAVTTCNKAGYERYGRRMLQSFVRHWPREIQLYFYAEDFSPEVQNSRVFVLDLLTSCPDLAAFKERHRENLRAHGRPPPLSRVVLKHKKRKPGTAICLPKLKIRWVKGRSYLWEAVRFSHKMFAIFDAVERCGADVLFWVDADVFTFADVPLGYLDSLVPGNCLLSFLSRPNYSECGFVGYNLRHPAIHTFMASFKRLYTDDTLFMEKQYHDSWLFDVLRRKLESVGYETHDIADGLGARGGHVFINCSLGKYMDHAKGGRWTRGASREADLFALREEAYWLAR